jgi:hypothetical protein
MHRKRFRAQEKPGAEAPQIGLIRLKSIAH